MSEENKIEFERLAKQMIKFICDHGHPHMHVYIDQGGAELSEGIQSIVTQEFILD